jgi:putative ABC transport system permease protein
MADWEREVRRRIEGLGLGRTRESEIVEELAHHLEDHYEELLAGGASPQEARAIALSSLSGEGLLERGLGRVERRGAAEPAVFGARRRNMIGDLWQDARYGLRVMRNSPGFALIAVLTLALGIGANTAIFSLVHGILMRPLPYREPGRLVLLKQSYPQMGSDVFPLSHANFAMYRDQNSVFEAMAAYTVSGLNLTGTSEPERLRISNVTVDFFSLLGVEPTLGRAFRPEEDVPNGSFVCVLSYGFWQRRFAGDPEILGRALSLNNVPAEVIGVMPRGFEFPEPGIDLWIPVGLNPQRRSPFYLSTIARLKPGVGPDEAAAETTALMWNDARQGSNPPPEGADLKTIITPLKESLVGKAERPLLVLLGAVGLVLLIACANVANLLLARAASRTKEMAVRFALGATPGRVVRQLLTEGLLLSIAGAGAGAALAWLGVRMIDRLPVEGTPRIAEVSVNASVLMFTAGVAVLTGLLFGSAPALRAYRLGLEAGMREGMRGSASASHRRMSNLLVAAQFACSVILLIGAGLLLKSFERLTTLSPGFQPDGLLTMRISLPRQKYEQPAQRVHFYRGLLERVRALPGVRAAGIDSNLPFTEYDWADNYVAEGHEPAPGGVALTARVRVVSPGYFEAMGMPLLGGREFSDADADGSQPVAIVDETLARRYWPDGDAVGKRIRFGWTGVPAPWMTILGVVPAVRHASLTEKQEPYLYLPHAQQQQLSMYLAVRTDTDTAGVASAIRGEVLEMDADLPVYFVRTMPDLIGQTLSSQRLTNLLLTAFALLAAVLAAVGAYGIMSVYVSSRTTEFGIRLALGAQPADLLRFVLRQGLLLTLGGTIAGVAGAVALTRTIKSLLFEVSATDPAIFVGVPLLLLAVGVAACYVPARRGARVDPLVALKCE